MRLRSMRIMHLDCSIYLLTKFGPAFLSFRSKSYLIFYGITWNVVKTPKLAVSNSALLSEIEDCLDDLSVISKYLSSLFGFSSSVPSFGWLAVVSLSTDRISFVFDCRRVEPSSLLIFFMDPAYKFSNHHRRSPYKIYVRTFLTCIGSRIIW